MTALQLWTTSLDELVAPESELAAALSAPELARAARFLHARDRRRHLAAHCFLRSLLAERLSCEPGAIEIVRGTHGKPRVVNTGSIGFSLSHSGGMAACAIADGEVGVDLERDQRLPEADAIAARILAPASLARWRREGEPARDRSLLRHWTRYEALAKAEGGGLVAPPAPLDADPAPGTWMQAVHRGVRWSILTLAPGTVPDCIVSVAICGAPAAVSLHAWQGLRESATVRES
jgi:4'-phosphopantetheinyl transferase